jgi:hypothetical protein
LGAGSDAVQSGASGRARYRRVVATVALFCSVVTALLVVPRVATAVSATVVSDDFNRADGGLGSSWTATSDGGMAISSQAVVGTKSSYSGDIRTGETYAGDQSSQIQVVTQLSGSQWIGVGVRAQNGGRNLYMGLYWWNSGSPVLMVFKRSGGAWSQLGSSYSSGVLAAGTQLQLAVTGSTLTFSQNGAARITVTDSSFTGGAPAIMAYGTPTADNWQGTGNTTTGTSTYTVGGTASGLSGSVVLQDNGGDDLSVSANGPFVFKTGLAGGASYSVTVKTNPSGQTCTVANGTGTVANSNITNVTVSCVTNSGLSVQYVGTDANGVDTYTFTSANDGPSSQTLRVVQPTHPTAGIAHNFLYALPVEPLLDSTFGDPISTLQALDAANQYNLTIIVPSFGTQPWYADNPLDASENYETFMTAELQPWVKAHLSTTGQEQHWLIGFSKSGIGAEDLILKHPDVFTLVASWDFPADMSSYDQFGANSADNYGNDANFQTNYRLTPSFVDGHKTPFLTNNRIWIGGYNVFQQDISDYDALLTSEGIAHTTGTPSLMAHRWDSGWIPGALAALYQDSLNLH